MSFKRIASVDSRSYEVEVNSRLRFNRKKNRPEILQLLINFFCERFKIKKQKRENFKRSSIFIIVSCSRSSIKSDKKDRIVIFAYNYQIFLSDMFYLIILPFFYTV